MRLIHTIGLETKVCPAMEDLKIIKGNLRSTLMASGVEGVRLKYLDKDYYEFFDEHIPFKQQGFKSLPDFLLSCKDTCRIVPDRMNPGEYVVHTVADASSQHILNLVQKATKKKKKSRGGGRSSFRPQGYGYTVPNPAYRHSGFSYRPPPSRGTGYSSRGGRPAMSTNRAPQRPATAIKPAPPTTSYFEEKKLSMKVTPGGWEKYTHYVTAVLRERPFGMLNKDLEREYMKRYKERLPDDWLDQLEGRTLAIINSFGNGAVQVTLLTKDSGVPKEKGCVNGAVPVTLNTGIGMAKKQEPAPTAPSVKITISDGNRKVEQAASCGIQRPAATSTNVQYRPGGYSSSSSSENCYYSYSDEDHEPNGKSDLQKRSSATSNDEGVDLRHESPEKRTVVRTVRASLSSSADDELFDSDWSTTDDEETCTTRMKKPATAAAPSTAARAPLGRAAPLPLRTGRTLDTSRFYVPPHASTGGHVPPLPRSPAITQRAPQNVASKARRVQTALQTAVRRNDADNTALQTGGESLLNKAFQQLDDAFSKLNLASPAPAPAPKTSTPVNPDVMKVIPLIEKKMEQHRRDVKVAVSLMEILQAQGGSADRTGGPLTPAGDSRLGTKDAVPEVTGAGDGGASGGISRDHSKADSRHTEEDIFYSEDSDWEDTDDETEKSVMAARLTVGCICFRKLTMVFCTDCFGYFPNSRVKNICQDHPTTFLTCDLLVCPACCSPSILELKEA